MGQAWIYWIFRLVRSLLFALLLGVRDKRYGLEGQEERERQRERLRGSASRAMEVQDEYEVRAGRMVPSGKTYTADKRSGSLRFSLVWFDSRCRGQGQGYLWIDSDERERTRTGMLCRIRWEPYTCVGRSVVRRAMNSYVCDSCALFRIDLSWCIDCGCGWLRVL